MRSLMIFCYLFIIATITTTNTFAEVNIAYGEFKIQHQEHLTTQSEITRSYSSRSLHKGFFGYGWCSSWDYHRFYFQGQERLSLCQQEITSTSKNKISFNQTGKPSEITTPYQQVLFIYENTKLKNTLTNKKTIYAFVNKGLITKILTEKYTFYYEYTQKQLSKVKKGNSWAYLYEYDVFANMTKWQSQHGIEKMSYNNDWDLINSYTQKDLCQNDYDYTGLNKSKIILQKRKCLSIPAQEIKYSFDVEKQKIKIQILNSRNPRLGEKNENNSTSTL